MKLLLNLNFMDVNKLTAITFLFHQICLTIIKIFELNEVDGALIGGSSLKFKDFLAIYKSAVKQII